MLLEEVLVVLSVLLELAALELVLSVLLVLLVLLSEEDSPLTVSDSVPTVELIVERFEDREAYSWASSPHFCIKNAEGFPLASTRLTL